MPTLSQKAIRKAWAPPPELSLSQWAAEKRYLSPESSAETGKWRNERTPYAVGVMDAVTDPRVERLTAMTAAQMLKTELLNNIVGYYIDQDPCPMLLVQPVENMGRSWVSERLNPMLRDSPCFAGKILEDNKLHKAFAGGFLAVGWAKSAPSLSGRPVRIVLFDEVDRYDLNVKKEGDPVRLGEKRAVTFHNRKIIDVSTPKLLGSSRIHALYGESDQRLYLLPCPNCNDFHFLRREHFTFDSRCPLETTHWNCPSCAQAIEHIKKRAMLADGVWKAQREFKNHAGFHINEFFSPWRTWGEIFDDFIEARKSEETLQTWVNLSEGLPFEPKAEKVEADTLEGLKEQYNSELLPKGVLWISAGIDTQVDRFEVDTWGFGIGEESWHVEKYVILGDPKNPETQDELDDYLTTHFTREDGHELPIKAAFIDSGGNRTSNVYDFCRGKAGRRIFPIKGASSSNPFDNTVEVVKQGRSKKYRCSLVIVHSAKIKKQLYDAFKATLAAAKDQEEESEISGAGLVHFGRECDTEFFSQITAEKLIRKRVGNRTVYQWRHDPTEGDYERNESLDTAVYARAALIQFKPDLQKMSEKDREKQGKKKESAQKTKKKRQRSKRSSWATSY